MKIATTYGLNTNLTVSKYNQYYKNLRLAFIDKKVDLSLVKLQNQIFVGNNNTFDMLTPYLKGVSFDYNIYNMQNFWDINDKYLNRKGKVE